MLFHFNISRQYSRACLSDRELSDEDVIVVIVTLLTIYLYWDYYRRNSLHLLFNPVTSPAKSASKARESCSVFAGVTVCIFNVS
jgi:hypothetical protein